MTVKDALLIAEDEPDLCEQLVELLSPLGCSILTAKDGKEMLTKAEDASNGIVAILSDIKMPIMTGLDVLRELRLKKIETPIVFLTGYSSKDLVVEALRLGAMDFMEKPFDYDELKSVVLQALDIGVQLKNIDHEVSSMAKKYQIPEKDMAEFNSIQRTLLIMKIKNHVQLKKKVS